MSLGCQKDSEKYILFIPNIRKLHNFYLHSKSCSLLVYYLKFLMVCADEIITSSIQRPDCHWREDNCHNDFCYTCIHKMETRVRMISKLSWRIRQICAKIYMLKIGQQKHCQKCNETKERFHVCYSKSLQTVFDAILFNS